jgi:hypothetical protein
MDLLGPFKTAPNQLKYLIVAVDYCTKWIYAEALAKITANFIKLFKRNILARFGVLEFVVPDNGTQFIDGGNRQLMEDLNIKQHFASVEHPQTSG